jgi:hypothetical protein
LSDAARALLPATLEALLDEAQLLRAIFAASYGTARRNHLLAQKHRRDR